MREPLGWTLGRPRSAPEFRGRADRPPGRSGRRGSGPPEGSVQLQHCNCLYDDCGLPRVQQRMLRQPIAATGRRLRRPCGKNMKPVAPCLAAGVHPCERAPAAGILKGPRRGHRASAPRPCHDVPVGSRPAVVTVQVDISATASYAKSLLGTTVMWQCAEGLAGGRVQRGRAEHTCWRPRAWRSHCINPSRLRGISKG